MRTTALLTASLFAALAASACGSSSGGDDDSANDDGGSHSGDGGGACIAGLTAIALSPSTTNATLDGGPAQPITFTATGTQAGGGTQPIDAAQLTWTVARTDDTPPGTIAAGVFTPNPAAGGTVTVTATDGCVSGTATVSFFLDVVVGTPGDPAAWDGTPVATGAPTIVYPSDQTRFPRNIYRTLFQWRTSGFSEFRLTFTGPAAQVTVFTDGAHDLCAGKNPAAGCWEADETAWSYIAGSNAGDTVTWTVDALDSSTAPATIRRAGPITIGFSERDVRGAIFYWSTTSAGIRRANVAAAVPEDYMTGRPQTTYGDGDQVKCVACHVVSRDGKYLAAPVDATQSGKSLWITEVTADAPPTPLVKDVANTEGHGFATISPDDGYVVSAWGGNMWMVDRATGAYLADVPIGVEGTHPDWSPDNTQMVFATGRGDAPGGAAIDTIAYLGGTTWGAVTTLVPAAGATNLFPMFSPDGDWIAYSRGSGGHGDNSAQLFLVGASGGNPVELLNANRVVSNQTTDGQHQNSQPTWAPPGDLYWIAFNSKREYGVVSPAGTQQIWVAAIDPARVGSGEDPSYPAFRLQFQGLDEDNHRAFWTEDVRDPTPTPDGGVPLPDAGQCIAAGHDCVPGADLCCDDGYVCDTQDDGATYTCVPPFVP
jgi:hypothetical protein